MDTMNIEKECREHWTMKLPSLYAKKAQEEGVGIDDIIKREIEPDLKMIKFI